jgi:L-2-hydroxyglutarate oxidase LhgO
MIEVETVVIGAGVVGLATARELALSRREVLVLEKAKTIGTETSSRNSEVIHSGIYYAPGSLKAELCVQGRTLLYEYCAHRSVPHRQVGKLIVATENADVAILERYRSLALANNAGDLAWLTAKQVSTLEPALTCIRGLYAPHTGIVDSHALMISLWGDLQASGGDVVFNTAVVSVERRRDGKFELTVSGVSDSIVARQLVNSAGLQAPALALRMAGCVPESSPSSYFARGHYYSLSGVPPFSHLVYPVAEAAGLGIHVTLDLAGRVKFGPDVEWVTEPDYRFDDSRREHFAAAIRRYFPAIDAERLQPDYIGVRPKISGPGQPAVDFRIDGPAVHGIDGLVQLYGIESPGLTASLAIARRVRAALQR